MHEKSGSVVKEACLYFIPNPGLVMGFGTLEFDVKCNRLWAMAQGPSRHQNFPGHHIWALI